VEADVATRRVKLEEVLVIPPDVSTLLRLASGGCPALVGRGSTAFVCPGCGTALCKGVAEVSLRHIVFRCDCGILSRVKSP
jgi:hypothetical protein